MKSFRLAAVTTALMLGAFSTLTYTACNTDKCANSSCATGTHCVDGDCVDDRTKFEKTWTAPNDISLSSQKSIGSYSCIIAEGATVGTVTLDANFSNRLFNHSINATVSGDIITIPLQYPDGTANASVSGTGTYSNGQIIWSYTTTDNIGPINYSGTWN